MFRLSTRGFGTRGFGTRGFSKELRLSKNFSSSSNTTKLANHSRSKIMKEFKNEFKSLNLVEKWAVFSMTGGVGCGIYYIKNNYKYYTSRCIVNTPFVVFAGSLLIFISPVFIPHMAIIAIGGT